ncbi:response regulator [Ruminiclostridium cellobioparum]|uniref:response regulator n=1 Tax=Ruminiclostridium cellobioparum TaxID=29355 RepID=UPI0004824126|nr:response regulator [Ruminiclostridium cellobioparum]
MNTNRIKVMLVDDEENTRNLLKLILDWESLGFVIAGEASSGQEGLNLMEELKPDLVISDIRMPFMDGLEFAGLVAENYPDVKVIILTAYEEFEYAKKGIKMGISDFLLKPVKRAEIKESVENLRNKIMSEQTDREEYEKVRKRLKESLPFLREKFLNELLFSRPQPSDMGERMEYYGLSGLCKYFQIAAVSPAKSLKGQDPENDMVQELLYLDTIKQYFKADSGVVVFPDFNSNAVIINSQREINLFQCCEHIKTLILNKFKCNVSIGVGNCHSDINQLRQGYKEAIEALNYKLIYGNNLVISYRDICIQKGNSRTVETRVETEEILFFIRAGLDEKVHELIDRKFEEISGITSTNSNEVRVFAISLITSILSTISEFELNTGDFFTSVSEVYSHILGLGNIPEMKEYIIAISKRITCKIKLLRENKKNNLMDKVITYIEDNIQNADLTLTSLAANFYINPSYLSRTFKQHTGFNFVEYLTRLRIQKAIEYFGKYDRMAYEVAESVGIPDPNYFGKCFKKYTGYSVNDYKKLNK